MKKLIIFILFIIFIVYLIIVVNHKFYPLNKGERFFSQEFKVNLGDKNIDLPIIHIPQKEKYLIAMEFLNASGHSIDKDSFCNNHEINDLKIILNINQTNTETLSPCDQWPTVKKFQKDDLINIEINHVDSDLENIYLDIKIRSFGNPK